MYFHGLANVRNVGRYIVLVVQLLRIINQLLSEVLTKQANLYTEAAHQLLLKNYEY